MRLYFLIPVLFSTVGFGQLKVTLSTGYGTYTMGDMKSLQEELQEGYPVDAKITESFPGYAYYDLSVTKQTGERFVIGGYFTYGSTGGRIHYEDYSGEVSSNQLVRYYSLGFPLGIMISDDLDANAWNFQLDFKPHFTMGELLLEFSSRIGSQRDAGSYEFRSFNFGIEPGFTAERRIGDKWGIDLFAGYNLTVVQGKLFFNETEGAYLQNEQNQAIGLDFSGLRVMLGLSYRF